MKKTNSLKFIFCSVAAVFYRRLPDQKASQARRRKKRLSIRITNWSTFLHSEGPLMFSWSSPPRRPNPIRRLKSFPSKLLNLGRRQICEKLFNKTSNMSVNVQTFLFQTWKIYKEQKWFADHNLNGMTTIEFLALATLHHRPNLCSWPMPAINFLPSSANVRLFTNPAWIGRWRVKEDSGWKFLSRKNEICCIHTWGMVKICLNLLSAYFQIRMKPSLEPVCCEGEGSVINFTMISLLNVKFIYPTQKHHWMAWLPTKWSNWVWKNRFHVQSAGQTKVVSFVNSTTQSNRPSIRKRNGSRPNIERNRLILLSR